MVTIPGGSFDMGAPGNEPGRFEEEGPVHRVTVRRFAAGKYDVTRGQWAAFMTATHRETPSGCQYSNPSNFNDSIADQSASWQHVFFSQDDKHPVVCISWTDAQDYVRWLSQRTGQKYRLLTEAEWEYAARAGSATTFPWGMTATREHANYGSEKCCGGLAVGRDRWIGTSPVGAFPPNAFGLYDMSGNVLQWVQDCFAPSYSGLPTDGSAYETSVTLSKVPMPEMKGKKSCEYRMLRGGDWGDPPSMIRSAFRNFAPAPGYTLENYRSAGVGFRVAKALE
jgi:formylglycine-generating enzyme required for sulfatase activity